MENKILSVIIPVYNEEKTISQILDKVLEVELIGGFIEQPEVLHAVQIGEPDLDYLDIPAFLRRQAD